MENRVSTTNSGVFSIKQISSTNTLVKISILSVLAYVIMLIEIPVIFFPGFLKIDLSDLPALVGGLALGPVAGIMVQLVKNILHFITKTDTGGVGELANFLVGVALILPATILYTKHKTRKSAITGLIIGIFVMAVVGAFANYYILIPFYSKFMPLDKIIEWSAAANGAIVDMKTLILYAIVPFNILKGILVAVLTGILYKKISPVLKLK